MLRCLCEAFVKQLPKRETGEVYQMQQMGTKDFTDRVIQPDSDKHIYTATIQSFKLCKVITNDPYIVQLCNNILQSVALSWSNQSSLK